MTTYDPDLHGIAKEHDDVVRIARLTHHIQRIREGMDEMKSTMREMATAISKLAVIEERQNQDRASMERAFNAIDSLATKHDQAIQRVMESVEKIEARLRRLEAAEPLQAQSSEWVRNTVWALAAAAAMFVAGKAGLF